VKNVFNKRCRETRSPIFYVQNTPTAILAGLETIKKCIADLVYVCAVAYPGFFFWGGGGIQQIQLRTEDREDGDLRAVGP